MFLHHLIFGREDPRRILVERWMKFFVSYSRSTSPPFPYAIASFRWKWLKINVLCLYREHILFGSLRDAVVVAWLIATTTMDIFYNGWDGRHERLEIHLLPRETQSNPVGWEEDLALFFLIFHRKLISRISPSGRRALDPPLSLCSAY